MCALATALVAAQASPSLITFLLARVPGVSLPEKSIVDTITGYKEYVEATSAFVPCFTRRRDRASPRGRRGREPLSRSIDGGFGAAELAVELAVPKPWVT